jgi:uncharacterized repeat protein (TIGR01451 family)
MFRRLSKRLALLGVLAAAVAGVALAGLDSTRALPEAEPNNTLATANPIDLAPAGEFVEADILPGGDLDIFGFDGFSSGRVWALVDTGTPVDEDPQGDSIDSFLELLDEDGILLSDDDNSGTGTGGDAEDNGEAALLAGVTLDETNNFFLQVTETSGTQSIDPYVLYAVLTGSEGDPEEEDNDDDSEAQEIISGSGQTAFIEGNLGDEDWFSVEAEEGDRIFVAVRNTGDLDIVINVGDDEDLIATADSTGFNRNEGLAVIAPADGTYFIQLLGVEPAARGIDDDYLLMATNMGPGSEVAITKEGEPDPAIAGDTITWTVNLENEGDTAATNVHLTDVQPAGQTFTALVAPAGWTCIPSPFTSGSNVDCTKASMAPGETAEFTITAALAPDYDPETQACNEAVVTDSLGANAAEDCVEVDAEADLSVDKQGPAEIPAGEEFDYTIVVTNNGPSTVTEFTVVDTLPVSGTVGTIDIEPDPTSGSCVVALPVITCDLELTLDPGESATITIPFTFPPDTDDGSEQTNTATVESEVTDPDEENNEDEVTTTVFWLADLEVVKVVEDGDEILFGNDSVNFFVTVTNNGPSYAANVVLTDVLPPGFDDWHFDGQDSDYFCDEDEGTIVCERFTPLPDGESDLFNIHVFYTWGTPNGDLTNTASVESVNTAAEGDPENATEDPDLTNNSDSATTRYITPLIFSLGPTATSTIPAYGTGAALPVADEDIIAFDGFEFSILWDGSDVGVTAKLDAFAFTTLISIGAERGLDSAEDMEILMSFSQNMTIPATRTVSGQKLVVADADIVVFYPDELGSTTDGLFELFFDASDIGLTTVNEDIDAIDVDWEFLSADRGFQDIDLFISTEGTFSASGQTGLDEDIMVCTDLTWGPNTDCDDYEKAFDGSDVGLGSDSEDVNGLAAIFDDQLGEPCTDRGCAGRGEDFDTSADLMLVTKGNFSVPQPDPFEFPQTVTGANEDVLICFNADLGTPTECGGFAVYFDGSDFGLAAKELMNIEWEFFLFDDVICGDPGFSRGESRGESFPCFN